jgi:DNA-binding SARP family transcriptional activator
MNSHGSPASSRLDIHLLGRFSVRISGQVLPESAITGRKARALLKLIALQRHFAIVRERATDALWPELDTAGSTSQLYKALHKIRKAFTRLDASAGDWIELTDDLVRLAPPGGVSTDVRRFEAAAKAGLRDQRVSDLQTALSVDAGDLLPMDLYSEWTSLAREHHRQLYLDVVMALARHYERLGDLSEAAEMLRLALEKDPVLESAHRGLMRIFARRGQPTRAVRQYDRCRDELRRELAMDPSPETRKALEDIRERRTAADHEPDVLQVTAPAPMPPLIGRNHACATMDRLLDRLTDGTGSVLVIRGGVGTGKTRLIQELAARARRSGLRIFSGGVQEGSGTAAYGPFIELFDAVLHEEPALQDELPAALGRLVPSFTGSGVSIPAADRLAAQGYLFAQVHRFLARLSKERPAVLVLEDMHAADGGSRQLFRYLVQHGRGLPILFATTTREAYAAPSAGPSAVGGSVTVLELDRLSSKDHAELLRQHKPGSKLPPGSADRIYALSEGNPLFALELLRFWTGAGALDSDGTANSDGEPAHGAQSRIPPSLRYVVDHSLEGLSPPSHHVLYIAAVAGRHVSYELVSSVWSGAASSDAQALFEALEELVEARLLEERGLGYSFRHALVRETIYESISVARRRALHALAARRLVETSGDTEDQPVERIAHHFLRAGDTRQGVHYLIRSAERAETAYAHDDALRKYREALEVLADADDVKMLRIRCDVLTRMGDVYRACGRLEDSYGAYEEAVALTRRVSVSEPNLVELHRKIALVAIFRTEMDRSKRHLEKAFRLAGSDERVRARLLVTRALHLWHLNRLEEAYEVAHEALELAEKAGAEAEASQTCEILAMTCLPLGKWEEGLEYEKRRQLYGWSPEVVVATDAHLCLWEYHVAGDQPFQKARSFVKSVAEQAGELGDLRCVAVCHYALGTMHLWRGESDEAADELEASLDLHDRIGSPAGTAYALARKGMLHTLQGATEQGWKAIQQGVANAERASVRDHCLQRLYGVGVWNRMEAGDLASAGRLAEKSRALLDDSGPCAACALDLYPWLAYYYLRCGDLEHARHCGEAAAELAAKTENPIGDIVSAIINSSLCLVEQDGDVDRWRRQAFELAERSVSRTTYSPVVHYLDRMVEQQKHLDVAYR